ncbi:MAG TPA: NUDIX domain-containing protein [Bacillota bacterium]|nr:NUDIX domain-containing protein [Bacillota bacterium]
MSLDVKIHTAQTSILRELLFHPEAGYAKMQKPTGLTSDHFNFHIARLVELGMVEKVSRGTYRLTSKGKEYANRLDTDNNTIERQPKTAVILALERTTPQGETEYLFQERLKNPYFGYWGLPSGKLRWGETIVECAARESLEETGLSATFTVMGVYHEQVKSAETGDMLEDKIFFVTRGVNTAGTLQIDFEGGHNEWMTFDEAFKKDKKFESFKKEIDILSARDWLAEQTVTLTKAQF